MAYQKMILLSSALVSTFLLITTVLSNIVSINAVEIVPIKLYGLNYNTRQGPDWDPYKCKDLNQISADLRVLNTITNRLRLLSIGDCDQVNLVLNSIQQNNLDFKLWIGLWASNVTYVFEDELKLLRTMLSTGSISDNVLGITVGSEAVYREELTASEAIDNLNKVKSLMVEFDKATVPVSIVDVDDTYEEFSELFAASDIAYVNSFPFWENIPIDNAVDFLVNTKLVDVWNIAAANGKDLIVGETGWSSEGSNPEASDASGINQAKYLQDFYCSYDIDRKEKYFYFTGIDSTWRISQERDVTTVEGHFGIFYSNLTIKEHFANLTFTCPSTGDNVQYKLIVDGSVPVPIPTIPIAPIASQPTTPVSLPPITPPVASPAIDVGISPTSPSSESEPASCASYPACDGLVGDCCPVTNGRFLLCCTSDDKPIANQTVTYSSIGPSAAPVSVDPTEKPINASPSRALKSDSPSLRSDIPSSLPSLIPNGSNMPSLVPAATDNPTDRSAFVPSSPSATGSAISAATTTAATSFMTLSLYVSNLAIAGAVLHVVGLLAL